MDELYDTQSGKPKRIPERTSSVTLHAYWDRDHYSRDFFNVTPTAPGLLKNMPDNIGDHIYRALFYPLDEHAVPAKIHLRRTNDIPLNAQPSLCETFLCFPTKNRLRAFIADNRWNGALLVVKKVNRPISTNDRNQAIGCSKIESKHVHFSRLLHFPAVVPFRT